MTICHTNILKQKRLQSVLSLITTECYLASLDLKDAYYSVPIHPDHTSTSKWPMLWPKKIYKTYETTYSYFKIIDGPIIAIYIDNLINVGLTFDECVENVIHNINKTFEFIGVNYTSRQIYILNKTVN